MKRFATVLFVLIAPALFGQQQTPPATTPDQPCMKEEMKPGKDSKIEHFFAAPADKVKQAIVDAMKAIECTPDKQTDTEIQGQRKRHIGVMVGSGGEVLSFTLAPATENGVAGTKVVGDTKKTFAGRMGQKSWTDAVLTRAECLLKAQ